MKRTQFASASFAALSFFLALSLTPHSIFAEEGKLAAPAAPSTPKLDFTDLQRLADLDSSFARQVLVLAGQAYLKNKEPKKAVGMYKQALTFFPGDMQMTEDMANAQLAGGDIEGGTKSWAEILQRQGKDVGTRIRYANYLDQAKQGDKAIAVMRELVMERPDDASLRYWITDAYVRQAKPDEAEKELKSMAKSFPNDASEIQRRLDLLKPPAPPEIPTPAPVVETPVEKKVEAVKAEVVKAEPVKKELHESGEGAAIDAGKLKAAKVTPAVEKKAEPKKEEVKTETKQEKKKGWF